MKKVIQSQMKIEDNKIFIGIGINYNFIMVLIDYLIYHMYEFVYAVCLLALIVSATNFADGKYKGLNLIICLSCFLFMYLNFIWNKKRKQSVINKKWEELFAH